MKHDILPECKKEFKEINKKMDTVNAQLFNLKDNDLKHLAKNQDRIFKMVLGVWATVAAIAVGVIVRFLVG